MLVMPESKSYREPCRRPNGPRISCGDFLTPHYLMLPRLEAPASCMRFVSGLVSYPCCFVLGRSSSRLYLHQFYSPGCAGLDSDRGPPAMEVLGHQCHELFIRFSIDGGRFHIGQPSSVPIFLQRGNSRPSLHLYLKDHRSFLRGALLVEDIGGALAG